MIPSSVQNTPATEIERTVLVLQGGGALGAYQAGAYAALLEAGYTFDWLAGISIGSINAALIAGNPPAQQVQKLREFWELVSSGLQGWQPFYGDKGRQWYNEISAAQVAMGGVPGFFKPRLQTPLLHSVMPPSPGELGLYDTAPLRETLEKLIDFDYLNRCIMRFSVGAVQVNTGNFKYFDSKKMTIRPEHIMASGALPEGFPPVEVDGEWYWDGGLVSNTPLQYVLDEPNSDDMCVFQIDLFSALGDMPQSIQDVTTRQKDIRFSSRTRLNTNTFRNKYRINRLIKRLLEKNPDVELRDDEKQLIESLADQNAVTIAHLIYRQKDYETHSKDYEFSRISVEERWQAGMADARFLLEQPAWKNRRTDYDGVKIFDFNRHSAD